MAASAAANNKQATSPATAAVTPTENDVLSGRGKSTTYWPGNKSFRKLVSDYRVPYVLTPRTETHRFCKIIVDTVWEAGGRFLKQDNTTKLWYEVDKSKAIEKARQALSEDAPKLLDILNGGKYESERGKRRKLHEPILDYDRDIVEATIRGPQIFLDDEHTGLSLFDSPSRDSSDLDQYIASLFSLDPVVVAVPPSSATSDKLASSLYSSDAYPVSPEELARLLPPEGLLRSEIDSLPSLSEESSASQESKNDDAGASPSSSSSSLSTCRAASGSPEPPDLLCPDEVLDLYSDTASSSSSSGGNRSLGLTTTNGDDLDESWDLDAESMPPPPPLERELSFNLFDVGQTSQETVVVEEGAAVSPRVVRCGEKESAMAMKPYDPKAASAARSGESNDDEKKAGISPDIKAVLDKFICQSVGDEGGGGGAEDSSSAASVPPPYSYLHHGGGSGGEVHQSSWRNTGRALTREVRQEKKKTNACGGKCCKDEGGKDLKMPATRKTPEISQRKKPATPEPEPIHTPDESCSVCIEEFKSGDVYVKLNCGHIFHDGCLDLWMAQHVECPNCRFDIRRTSAARKTSKGGEDDTTTELGGIDFDSSNICEVHFG